GRAGGPFQSFFFPGRNQVALTSLGQGQIGPSLAGKSKPLASADLATLAEKAKGSHVWVVMGLDDAIKSQFQAGPAAMLATNPAAKVSMDVLQRAKGMGVWAKLDGGQVSFTYAMLMPDGATAQQVVTDLQNQSQQQANDAATKMMMALLPASVKTLVDEMQASQQSSADGALAVFTARFSVAALEAAIGDAAKMAPMFGGRGGMPGVGTPPPDARDTPPPDSGGR